MNILAIIYIVLMLISIYLIGLSSHAYQHKFKDLIYKYTSYLTLLILIWLFCIFMIQMEISDSLILFFHEAKFISVISIPILFYALAFQVYKKHSPSKTFYYIIGTIGVLLFIGIMTNPVHHLFRKSFSILKSDITIVTTINGPFFHILTSYGYILLSISFILLVLSYLSQHTMYRKREFYLMLGASIPIITNIIFITIGSDFNLPYDYTPISFFISLLIYYIALFKFSPKSILQRSRESMMNHMTSGSMFIDFNGTIFDANQQMLTLLSLESNQTIGRPLKDITHPLVSCINEVIEKPEEESVFYEHKGQPIHKYFLLKSNEVFDTNMHIVGHLILLTDVSELQYTLNQLEYIGSHDDLTGVYNRYYFQLQLKALDNPIKYPIAIVVGDINGLKYINDTYGHAIGDSLLVEAAEKIIHGFKNSSVVCRIGGDEFVILVPNTTREEIQLEIYDLESQAFSMASAEENIGISLDYAIKYEGDISLQQLFKEADANMYLKKVMSGSSSRDNNLQLLLKILSGKDIETNEHLTRTSLLAAKFAAKLHLEHKQTNDLILLSQLHDIGKTVIPDKILFKPNSLDPSEWVVMKTHSVKGYEIISASPTLKGISKYVLHHHEHFNGQGYPSGLKDGEIPYLSRIIAIIDAYDVMTNKRIYKNAMPKEEAIKELRRCQGTQFDPELCVLFIDMLEEE